MAGEYIINFTDPLASPFTVYPHEIDGPDRQSTPRKLVDVNTGTKEFTILGDFTYRFVNGFTFDVENSTGNDGTYTVDVAGSTYSSGTNKTTITVVETVPSAVVDGDIVYTIPSHTSLSFPGRGTLNYGESLNENLLHLLENFANDTSPDNPIIGQLWYDKSTTTMKAYDGAVWMPVGGGAFPATELLFGTGTGIGSDPTLTYDSTSGLFSLTPAANTSPGSLFFEAAGASSGADASGGNVSISTGDGDTSGNGGDFELSCGTGGDTGTGGNINISAGTGGNTSGDGGAVTIQGGNANGTGEGGSVTIQAGSSNDGIGADAEIDAGNGTTQGGSLSLSVGSADDPTTGHGTFTVNTPIGAIINYEGGGGGGNLSFVSPFSSSLQGRLRISQGGGDPIDPYTHILFDEDQNVTIHAGDDNFGIAPGSVTILSGSGLVDNPDAGTITIQGGAAGTGDAAGGEITIQGGTSSGTEDGGSITILGGLAGSGGSNNGGTISVTGGDGGSGNGNGGQVTVAGGEGGDTGGGGGSVNILGGNAKPASSSAGGNVSISGGQGDGAGNGGNVEIAAGISGGGVFVEADLDDSGIGNIELTIGSGSTNGNRIVSVDQTSLNHLANLDSGWQAKISEYVVGNVTTDNTQTELFVDGTDESERLVLSDNTTWRFEIYLVARRTDATDESAAYEIKGCIDRNSGVGTVAIVGSVSVNITAEDTAAWDVAVDADTANGSLRIQVTGEAAKTIKWVAFVKTVEVTS